MATYKLRLGENTTGRWQHKWVDIEADAIADIGQGNKKLKKTQDVLADMGIEDDTISAILSDIEAMQTLISQLNSLAGADVARLQSMTDAQVARWQTITQANVTYLQSLASGLTAITTSDANKLHAATGAMLPSGTQQANISNANAAHSLLVLLDASSALNALGTKINSILAALDAFGITA